VAKVFLFWRERKKRIIWNIALTIGWIGLCCHLSMTLISVLRGNAKYHPEELKSATQRFLLKATNKMSAHMWGWFVLLYWRFVVPSDIGVKITLRLHRNAGGRGDAGPLLPRRVMATSFQLFALLGALGAIFHERWETDDSVDLPIVSALRSKPFAYIAAPLWFLMSINFGVGIYLTCVQKRLENQIYEKFLITCGAMLYLSSVLCNLIILEQERFTWVFMICFGASFCAWVLALNRENLLHRSWKERLVPATYVIVLVGLTIGSCLHFVFCFFFAAAFCFYPLAVQNGQIVYATLTPLIDKERANQIEETDVGFA